MQSVGLSLALWFPLAGSLAVAAPPPPPRALELFVSTDGADDQPGTKERPFGTLERARDGIRRLKAKGPLEGPVTVRIRGGTYERTKTFRLQAEDSGTPETPIVYRGDGGEIARLVGGTKLESSWFTPVRDPDVLRRLEEEVRGNVREVDLRARGITDYGELGSLTGGLKLFWGGRRLPLARWPNQGYALARRGQVLGVAQDGVPRLEDEGRDGRRVGFRFEGDPPNQWHSLEGVWLRGYWHQEYFYHAWQPRAVSAERQEISFDHGVGDHLAEWRRFFAANVLEELDDPGEWYLDRGKGVLYVLPPADPGPGPIRVSMMQDPMIALEETAHVTIRGLVLEVTRGLAVSVGGGTHNRIAGCIIRSASQGAILAGGTENGVVGCDIHDLDAMGIRMSGGDRRTLTPAGLHALNNHIHHYALHLKSWHPGIQVQGVGQRVAHNRIHHAPQYAISYEGNDHVFEYNEMHDLCLEMSDVGVIGCGTDWTFRGNVIRHNFVHHIPKRPYPGTIGVYLDNCASSAEISGNVFYKVLGKAVLIGGGRDNLIENNVFIECEIPVSMDNRGLRWETRWGHFRPGGPMYEPLRKFRHDQPPWSTRYPRLARILDEIPQAPLGNTLERNLSVRSGWRDPEEECRRLFDKHIDRSYMKITDNHVTGDDPGFVDAGGMNFQLREDSIVYRMTPGFKRIPFERIGLHEDEVRATWPVPRRRD